MSNIITSVLSIIHDTWEVLLYIVTDIGILLRILIDPFLVLMILFTASHFYTLLVSRTRKQLITNYFVFFGKVGNGLFRVGQMIIPVAMGAIQSMFTMLQGLASNATVGSVISVAIVAILAVYAAFSFL